jgi:hypothetical protein
MAKKFDCVKMKHDIQEQFYKETEGMTLKERFYYLKNKKITSPILLKFIKDITAYQEEKNNSCVLAESQAEYTTD